MCTYTHTHTLYLRGHTSVTTRIILWNCLLLETNNSEKIKVELNAEARMCEIPVHVPRMRVQ